MPVLSPGIVLGVVVAGCSCAFALNPSLDISQYGHDVWTVRSGFIKGNVYAMAQTTDGYLWLGTEFGLSRFDGVRSIPWEPPAGQRLPANGIYRLVAARDGTLWIGTFAGLSTWSGGKLTRRPELDGRLVASLLEDREGTLWAGVYGASPGTPALICAIRSSSAQCYGQDGVFGKTVDALLEDSSGNLWAGAQSGLWRCEPGPRTRYAAPPMSALTQADDGRLLMARYGTGLMQLAGKKVQSYPIRGASNANRPLPDRDVNSNKLLRDRDGGLWIGTVERGLIHVHNGRTDLFSRSDGLSGDVVLSLLEDREGSIWVATTGGLDRFRELPVTTISVKQGLSSDATQSVLAATDGSIWVGTHDGLSRLNNGQFITFGKASGLPDNAVQSLFQDDRGRIWASTRFGLAYFKDGRFVAVPSVPAGDVHFITGDKTGNLWLSAQKGLVHLLDGRLVEQIPWPDLEPGGSSADVLLSGREPGGVWLGFWHRGGLSYFKDHQLRVSYTAANGLGAGHVPDLRLERDGSLWVATEDGGLSRVKDGRIMTLVSKNGLPCETIHWTIENEDHSMWLYTGCGIVRIARTELDAWIADPKRRIETTLWDAAEGVRLRSLAATGYGPRVTKSADGKVWFLTGEGLQVIDLRHFPVNKLPPPVHIEQIKANGKVYWQNSGGGAGSNLAVPPRIHDLQIDYTALSLAVPEKVRFKYKLEGQDQDWKEVINTRQAQYTNLPPRQYRFRVIASNNNGLWNETGDSLDFSILPELYQTNGFRALCAASIVGMLWLAYYFRDRRLQQQYNMRLQERLDERARIARELHDTLLQSFQGSLYRFQAARNLFARRPEDAFAQLDSAISSAENALAEGRGAIRDLRVGLPQLRLQDLLTAIGQEFRDTQDANGQAVAFQVIMEGQPQTLSPLLQDEIYRIAREVLRNAFQHACPHRIEAAIQYDPHVFRLRIRDDGKGIDPKVLEEGARPGHWGLPGIRERAKRIGARLGVWSETGAGTEVELTVPARIAYGRARPRGGLSLFRKSKVES